MAFANRLAGGNSWESSTIQKTTAVTNVIKSHSQQEVNMHHTYDYADPDICLQHTNIVLKQPRNGEKGHPFLTSKQGKSTMRKHLIP